MTAPFAIGERILAVRGYPVLVAADLAELYGVPTRVLNQAVKRHAERFPVDFAFQLTRAEQREVVTTCDHLYRLRFAAALPWVFTEHGAIMAVSVLNSPAAVSMSVFVVRAFVQMREQLVANAAILRRLAEIDATLLQHDQALRALWQQLQPLLAPPSPPPKRRIGFRQDAP